MGKLNRNNKGLSKTELLVGLVLLAAICVVGLYAWQANNDRTSETERTNQATTEGQTETNSTTATQTETERTGTFEDVGDKTGSGTVTLVENEDGDYTVRLEDDFTVQSGPALYVSFANDGVVDKDTLFAELQEFEGMQEYGVPEDINVEDYDQVMIYCEEFSVAFSVADLN